MIRRLAGQGTAALLMALSLAACSHDSRPKPSVAPVLMVTPDRIDAIQADLLSGNRDAAEKQLKALLSLEPMNPSLQLLSNSIDKDPQDLMGPNSYPYTVRDGEAITDIAQHLLGNHLKAYQLARYNKLATPVTLVAGQILRIPGELMEPKPQPLSPSVPASERPKHSKTGTSSVPKAVASSPAKSAPNPAAAQRFRAQGLAALNRGAVGEAVALLRKAQALDPANALISRDLGRAERIQATVRGKK